MLAYSLFKRYPLKIIRGTRTGPANANATLVDGAAADKRPPRIVEIALTNDHILIFIALSVKLPNANEH